MLNAILATRQSKKTFQIHFKPTLDSDSMRITHPALFAAVLAATLVLARPAVAEEVTGELASPSATTTIDGKQLPPPNRQHPRCRPEAPLNRS
jgi:hypothetical protein